MHYDANGRYHGLPHDPFKALVVPWPIGWISTTGKDGITNLAPYSFFNAVSDRPPMVMFASGGHKDSLRNIEDSCTVVFGQVVGIYIDERFIDSGIAQSAAMRPPARLGCMDYSVLTPEDVFAMNRPVIARDGLGAGVAPGHWDGVYR